MRYGYYGYGIDSTYLLIIAVFLVSMAVQAYMRGTFSKYSKIRNMRGMTGADAARQILDSEGLYQVQVLPVGGSLTDHYDPRTKTVSLSESVFGSTSLAAAGVAAHECGHAIQDAKGYAPLNIRTSLVPAANFGANFSWPLFLVGLFFSSGILIRIAILLYILALLFQLVTLPVEFNASSRAMEKLKSLGLLQSEEYSGTQKVLRAAAMTYVAAAAASVMYLIRMLILSGDRRRND